VSVTENRAAVDTTPSALPADAPPAPPKQKRWRHIIEVALPPILLGLVIIGLWYYVSYVLLDDRRRFLLRPPHQVLKVGFLDWDNFHEILDSLWVSTKVALMGLAISVVLGILIAVLMSQAKIAERAIFPYMVTLQAIPILAIVPIIYSMFGGGEYPRVIVVIMISIFPIVTNTLFGLQSVDQGQHDLFTLRGANRWTRLWKLQFPAALPNIFTGFRISAGLAVIGAVVGEQFFRAGNKPGIGIVIESYRQKGIYPQVWGGLILAATLGIIVFLFFGWLSNAVVGHWYDPRRR